MIRSFAQHEQNGIKWRHSRGGFFAVVLVLGLFMAGCTKKPSANLPFYEYQKAEGLLEIEGIRYLKSEVLMDSPGMEERWIFTGELAEEIGVCGGRQEYGGDYTIYAVQGDEGGDLVYIRPNQFTFGPYQEYVCVREGVRLETAAPETVSHMVVSWQNQDGDWMETAETADMELIEDLLMLYNSRDSESLYLEGTYKTYQLDFYHREYPVFYFTLRCSYHTESGIARLKCADGSYRLLPSGFVSLLDIYP